MRRVAPLVLVAGLVGLGWADDTPLPKMPKFKDYAVVPEPVRGMVKEVKDDAVVLLVTEMKVKYSGGSGRRPPRPTTGAAEKDYTFALHPDALVRWSRPPDRKDMNGKVKPLTPAETQRARAPFGAPGYAGDKLELAKAQNVELTLLRPLKVRPDELLLTDLRVKWVVIQGSQPDPRDVKPAPPPEPEKKKKA